jgi:hypothetical protein
MTENLDLVSAEFGRSLSEINGVNEKLLQDVLSVLQEQGLCAFFLYLKARGKAPGNQIEKACHQFLCGNPALKPHLDSSTKNTIDAVKKLSERIDDLLFARDLLMQALIYARYHLKVKEAGGSKV